MRENRLDFLYRDSTPDLLAEFRFTLDTGLTVSDDWRDRWSPDHIHPDALRWRPEYVHPDAMRWKPGR